MSLLDKTKSRTIQEPVHVDVADIWNGRYCSYPACHAKGVGRSGIEKRKAYRDHYHSDVNSGQPEVSRGHSSYGNEPEKKTGGLTSSEGPNIKCLGLPELSDIQSRQPIFAINDLLSQDRAEPEGMLAIAEVDGAQGIGRSSTQIEK